MTAETHEYSISTSWKQLYLVAIREPNSRRVSDRVTQAERAIVARARELFSKGGDDRDEKEALDDAMYALHALETSCRNRVSEN